MKIGDRIEPVHLDHKKCVLGTVTDIKGKHVSVQWDGWNSPRWIQIKFVKRAGATSKKKIRENR